MRSCDRLCTPFCIGQALWLWRVVVGLTCCLLGAIAFMRQSLRQCGPLIMNAACMHALTLRMVLSCFWMAGDLLVSCQYWQQIVSSEKVNSKHVM